jgi:hypothetical protein
MARLEVTSKIENVVKPLAGLTNTDVFLALETGKATYNNEETNVEHLVERKEASLASLDLCRSSQMSEAAVKRAFAPYLRASEFAPHESFKVDTARWPRMYTGKMYKKDLPQKEHISNVLGQMWHQRQCMDMIQQHEDSMQGKYRFVIKVRDNTLAVRPVVPQNILSIKRLIFKECAAWGGVNDKVVAMPREYLEGSLGSTFELMMKVMDDRKLEPYLQDMSRTAINTEQILYWTLRYNRIPFEEVNGRTMSDILPFVDGRCMLHGTEDRWCVVTDCKDCHPAKPWALDVRCTTVNGSVYPRLDIKCDHQRHFPRHK